MKRFSELKVGDKYFEYFVGTDEMSLKDEFYKKIVKNEDSEEFINWVMGVEDENELDN